MEGAGIGEEGRDIASNNIQLPTAPSNHHTFTYTPPLQLLAYHIARLRGTDVDQPRNLAKTVTVE